MATKAAASRTSVKKTSAKKTSAKKTPARKTTTTKTPAKKTIAKSSANKAARKYSPAASAQVGEELHEMHEGKLHIGTSDKLVTNPKQAIAIGLAEARRAGKKVPPNPNDPKK